ncbi:hypothetical protein ACFQ0G_42385 [Streptomyces chiangmaiensis]
MLASLGAGQAPAPDPTTSTPEQAATATPADTVAPAPTDAAPDRGERVFASPWRDVSPASPASI